MHHGIRKEKAHRGRPASRKVGRRRQTAGWGCGPLRWIVRSDLFDFVARVKMEEGYLPRFVCYLHAALYSGRLNVPAIKQSTGIQNLDQEAYLADSRSPPPPPRTTRHRRLPRPRNRQDRRAGGEEGAPPRTAGREAHGPDLAGRDQGARPGCADEGLGGGVVGGGAGGMGGGGVEPCNAARCRLALGSGLKSETIATRECAWSASEHPVCDGFDW